MQVSMSKFRGRCPWLCQVMSTSVLNHLWGGCVYFGRGGHLPLFDMMSSEPVLLRSTQFQWDFFARGRLMCWGTEKDHDNHFWQASELVRTGKVPEASTTAEILCITQSADDTDKFDTMRINPATRSAQKGAEVWRNVYQSLLTSSKALSPHARPLLAAGDEAMVVDLHVHAGDHALGSVLLSSSLSTPNVAYRHILVKLKEKRSIAAVEWTQKRLGTFLCTKWLKQEVKLFSKSGDTVPPLMTETTAFGLQFVFGKKAGCFCYIGA